MTPESRNAATRVLSGDFKGRHLRYPPDRGLRPTMQRVRGAIFDSIASEVRGAVFADLYSAAGGVGIEALSRGASRTVFVEHDPAAVACLRENLERFGVDRARYQVRETDVNAFLSDGGLRESGSRVVFADPPYDDDVNTLLERLAGASYPEIRLLVVEYRTATLAVPARFELLRERRYGSTRIAFLAPTEGDES